MDTDRFLFDEPRDVARPTLEQLSAHRAALTIWYNYVIGENVFRYFNWTNGVDPIRLMFYLPRRYQSICNRNISTLPVPQLIEDELKLALTGILNETKNWLKYFLSPIFRDGFELAQVQPLGREEVLNCCVWSRNGKIDHIRSAMMLSALPQINPMQYFILHSRYCLANELVHFQLYTLRPRHFQLNTLGPSAIEILWTSHLFRYWITFIKGEVQHWTSLAVNNDEIRDLMRIWFRVLINHAIDTRNKYAFEYFWTRLDVEHRAVIAAEMYPSMRHLSDFLLPFLSNLSTSHQRRVIAEYPDTIVVNFVLENMLENALSSWHQTKNIITNEKFYTLIRAILILPRHIEMEECRELLLHIWDTAADYQRSYILDEKHEGIVEVYFGPDTDHLYSGNGMIFLRKFLSLKSVEYRRRVFLEGCESFAIRSPAFEPTLTSDLIQLCIPNRSDRLEFRRLLTISEPVGLYFQILLRRRNRNLRDVRAITEKLRIFFDGDKVAIGFFKTLLLADPKIYVEWFVSDLKRWRELSHFIDDGFEGSEAVQIKYRLVGIFIGDRDYWSTRGCMRNVIRVVQHEFPLRLDNFKGTALNKLLEMIASGAYFEWIAFLENIRCFFDNDEEVTSFIHAYMPAGIFYTVENDGNAVYV